MSSMGDSPESVIRALSYQMLCLTYPQRCYHLSSSYWRTGSGRSSFCLGSVSSRCSGMSPRSPRKTAGRVRSSFVQIDQSGIRLPRLSRRNDYINYLCLHFRIHFTFFTWYLLRTFSGMFCVTDIAFYVIQKLTDFLAKQNHDLLQSAREYS